MTIATRKWSSRLVRSISGLSLVALAAFALSLGLVPTQGANPPTATAVNAAIIGVQAPSDRIDPSSVSGATSCVKCHKSELDTLTNSKHHSSLNLIRSGSNIAKYAKAVGISTSDVLKNSVCVGCHSTPQGSGSGVHAISSVSCESCHGGSVGKTEWLKLHASENITDEQRAACDKAGMIRSSNIYAIAKNCFGCHVVSNKELVNAGHPASNKLELVGWSSGEVRHNFQVDQKTNATAPSLWMKINKGAKAENRRRVKFVVGILVDLEVSLNNAKNAGTKRSDFLKGTAKRLKNAIGLLDDIVEDLEDKASDDLVAAQKAVAMLGKVTSSKIENIKAAEAAYPVVEKAARSFETKFDGSELSALDKLIDKEAKPKGDVFSP